MRKTLLMALAVFGMAAGSLLGTASGSQAATPTANRAVGDTEIVYGSGTTADETGLIVAHAACPAGYGVTGGGGTSWDQQRGYTPLFASYPDLDGKGWTVHGPTGYTAYATAVCTLLGV
jgi:hypothetical protein